MLIFTNRYGDLWEDKKENTPRWRTHYERTGRMDIRFRAAPSLRVLVPDVATNENITKVNLTECPRLGAKRAREPSPTSGAPEAKGEPSEFLVIGEFLNLAFVRPLRNFNALHLIYNK
jgi:hypothetical protein